MTLLTFVQVVLRYLFHTGLVWSLEATSYSFGWLIVVGMAYGVRTRAHIAVDLLTRSIAPRGRKLVASVALLASLGYCVLMCVGSLAFVDGLMQFGHRAQDLPVPRWALASILPLGFLLLALRIVQAGWHFFSPVDDPDRRRVDPVE
jgi:C4-dicarboxylate transporter DctQ subunit